MAFRWSAFTLYLLTLNFVFHWYLFRHWLPGRRARAAAISTAFVLMAIQFLGRAWPEPPARYLLWPALAWTAVALHGVGFTAAVDVARRLWRAARLPTPASAERRAFLETVVKVGTVAASGGAAAFGVWRAYQPPQVTELEVRLPYLPKALDGFALVQISDIHIGAMLQRRFLDALVEQANALKPDLMALTGDLVDGTVEHLGGHIGALRSLRARHGTWFVTGNHDYYSGSDAWVNALSSMNIPSLRNRFVAIGDAQHSFDLIGVDDWSSRAHQGYDLNKAVFGRRPERASVLMAHQPKELEEVSSKGIGLQLSGHTHGGQMFPGTWISDAVWGQRSHGLSRWGGTTLYVSRGCGFVGPPQRAGSPPELVKIILRA